ncbi:citrate synthase 2 [Gephyromycinifex aptenodytis]|uniref:citrate synthase 2 n=1 Tax=Gephyromycinifex aptenodytis TaxID=2716227 RepID=UPI0014474718|nr:citrate synthase 2 [Gephyromycinifex aptenodytis]
MPRHQEGETAAQATLETRIAQADPISSVLRYRGVDINELVGHVSFDRVWGLLVCDDLQTNLPPAEPHPLPARTGSLRADVQSALATLAPVWGFRPLHDIDAEQALENLARASVLTLSFVAQSARGPELPVVPQRVIDRAESVAQRFLVRWRGEPDPAHVKALDAYFVAAAEHGLSPSTLTARVVASTGADVAACMSAAVGALSGPLHGGAPSRVLPVLEAAERSQDPSMYITQLLASGQRLMGFEHRFYRTEDPRAGAIRRICQQLGVPRYELACAVETAALEVLRAHHGPEVSTTLDYWAAVILDFAQVPPEAFSSLFACARTAGWSAHILEQKQTGGSVHPPARYGGLPPRALHELPGV